jgi:transposase InsO family protein
LAGKITDHNALFEYHRWQANLRVLEIEPVKTVPFTPISHSFVERLIGTVHREFLDYTLFWNAVDLERKLEAFKDYYNHNRLHSSLEGNTPTQVSSNSLNRQADLECYRWQAHCGGLVQLPMAA